MNEVTLIEITSENWEDVCRLDPGKEGREFVVGNAFSIAQSVFEQGWVIRGIQAEDRLAGFTMFGFSEEWNTYEICRFMMDWRCQGKGYGKRALKAVVDEMFRRYPCGEIYLSTMSNNARAKHVYESVGFVPTGETCGEGDNLEDIYRLKKL